MWIPLPRATVLDALTDAIVAGILFAGAVCWISVAVRAAVGG